MKIEEYQALAMRTSPDGHDRVLNGCLGLIGESGEIVDLVKKWKFQCGDDAEPPKDKLIDECGDVLWYCAELCEGINMNLNDILDTFGSLPGRGFADKPLANNDIVSAAVALSELCGRAYETLYYGRAKYYVRETYTITMIVIERIVHMVHTLLYHHCGVFIDYAMERNIEKLRKRYPDGFDPERSLHRDEQ